MQLHNHVDRHITGETFQALQGLYYIYDIKFVTLEVRENEISLRKWSGGTAHLRS